MNGTENQPPQNEHKDSRIPTKVGMITASKEYRRDLDAVLQRLKNDIERMKRLVETEFENKSEAIANHILSVRHVEDAIMRQGMALKNIGNPTPYPTSYDPSSPRVEPTADGLKM